MLDAGHDMSVHVHLRENQQNSRSADSVRLCVANEVPLVGVIFPSIMQSRIISCVLRDLPLVSRLSVCLAGSPRRDRVHRAHRGSTHENGAITPCLIMHVYFRLRTRTVRQSCLGGLPCRYVQCFLLTFLAASSGFCPPPALPHPCSLFPRSPFTFDVMDF